MESNPDLIIIIMASGLVISLAVGYLLLKKQKKEVSQNNLKL